MRDVEDEQPARLERADDAEEASSCSESDSTAVGSSRMRMRASVESARASSTSCRSATLSEATELVRVEVDVVALQQLARGRAGAAAVDQAEAALREFAAEKDVVGDAELGDRAELLIDDGDAGVRASRGAWRSEAAAPSSRIAPALAGSVPARMFISVDLPAPLAPQTAWTSPASRGKIHMVERQHSGKPAGQPARLQEGMASSPIYCGRNSAGRSVANQSSGRSGSASFAVSAGSR